jgi:hypothetical protein
LIKAGKAAARRLVQARILLLADRDECPDDEIVHPWREPADGRAYPGRAARVDYEYERKGVCHQLMMCEIPG